MNAPRPPTPPSWCSRPLPFYGRPRAQRSPLLSGSSCLSPPDSESHPQRRPDPFHGPRSTVLWTELLRRTVGANVFACLTFPNSNCMPTFRLV